ncbi:LrgB family protein [Sporosarcina ureilytica]|uniref:CidB/LrgB family autolysis modulator n=1 Tax=Sporosarcina ureilytica TaxID=298596 RepID=A0A1D8JG24_9BACL|nr:LrgB family protein [Sporosarcina ureilytica]AOV07652.1 hypothetical protein BI350_08955 [Sporosarcina ureilytica]
MQSLLTPFTAISTTVGLFLVMRRVYRRYPFAFFHPMLTTTTLICIGLIIFGIPYADYMKGGKWIEQFLGPCVVALAYPLYNQRKIMMQYKNAILLGISTGLITAMGSIIFFAKLFKVEEEIIYTVIPKSITTPVAIQISETMGGIPSLTAIFVMIAGFSGIIVGPYVMKYTGIESRLGKGLALGSASHALGVAKSTEYGELALSMASVSMTISAIIGSLIGPLLVLFV